MGFWFIAMWIVKLVSIYLVVRSLMAKPNSPQPKGLSDFSFPTTDPSRAIPVVFGTVKLTGPAVLWYGDFHAEGFSASGSRGKDVGFHYYLGFDLGLCHGPIDDILGLYFEDKSAGWQRGNDQGSARLYNLNNAGLFGGDTNGSGGIQGWAFVYMGDSNQNVDPYMQAKCSADYPGLATMAHIVCRGWPGWDFGGMYVGNSEYVKMMAATVVRCPNTLGLTGGKHQTTIDGGHDSNPACMLYEVLTNTIWGVGMDPGAIDTASFLAAGNTLYGEAFGLSMILEQQTEAKDFIAEILRHIDGDLYGDPETGLLTLALVRGDYDVDDIPELDESMVTSVEFSRRSWSETANVAQITFTSRAGNFEPRMAMAYDSANLARRGEKSPVQVEFRGIATDGPASLAATRVLRAMSYPFAQVKVTVNRKAYALRPAGVFKLKWSPLGIERMVLRVVRPSDGKLEDGEISIDCVEDAFSVSSTVYTNAGSGGWTDPIPDPVPASHQALLELPYQLAGGAFRTVAPLASRDANTGMQDFQVWSDPAGGTDYALTNGAAKFLVCGELEEEMPMERPAVDADGEWGIANVQEPARLHSAGVAPFNAGVNLCLIDSEILAWREWDPVTSKVKGWIRGLYDTVPAYHAGGARVWFFQLPLPEVYPSAGYPNDLTVAVKVLPSTIRKTLDIADATRMTLATNSRALRPVPPGRIRFNDVIWPETLTDDVVVTWAHRSRAQQLLAGGLVTQDDTGLWAPEGSYTIQVWVDGLLKRTETGITDDEWTWTTAMQTTDAAAVGSAVTIRITPVNGSLSGNYQERSFELA
jgi:hypothetical protein